MGVDVSKSTPSDPGGSGILDRIVGDSANLGAGLGAGLSGFLGGIGDVIGSLFGRREVPLDPVFSQFRADLEGDVRPLLDKVEAGLGEGEELGGRVGELNDELHDLIDPENLQSPLWQAQYQINDLVQEQLALHDSLFEALSEVQRVQNAHIPRMMHCASGVTTHNEHFSVANGSTSATVTVKAGWTGQAIVFRTASSGSGDAYYEYPIYQHISVSHAAGSVRTWPARSNVVIFYLVDMGEHETQVHTTPAFDPVEGVSHTIPGGVITAPVTGDLVIQFRVTWDAPTYHNEYRIRMYRNGSRVYSWGHSSGLGPLFPTLGDSSRAQTHTRTIQVQEGDELTFAVYTDATGAQGRVRAARVSMSWSN